MRNTVIVAGAMLLGGCMAVTASIQRREDNANEEMYCTGGSRVEPLCSDIDRRQAADYSAEGLLPNSKRDPEKKAERREVAREVFSALATGLAAASCGMEEGADRVACELQQTRVQMQREQAQAEEAFREEMEKNRARAAEMQDDDARAMAADEQRRSEQLAEHRAEIERMFADHAAARPAWSCWYGIAAGHALSMCFPTPAQCAQSFVDVAAGGLGMHGDRCLDQDSVVCVDAADGKVATSLCAASAVHCESARAELSARGWAVGRCTPS